jgi:hypothetical protein
MTTPQKRMGNLHIDPHTWGLIQSALILLPRRVGFRVLRKALNAWGGYVRNVAKSLAPEQTGLLKKSLKVKVVIPDASFNEKHHGRPAYVMVGPSRDAVGPVSGGRLLSIRKATKLVRSGGRVQTRRPSRYAHLVERGTQRGVKAHPFIAPAQAAGATTGMAVLSSKLEQGIAAEAASIAARN